MNVIKSKSGVMLMEIIVSMLIISIVFVMFYSVFPRLIKDDSAGTEDILVDYIQFAKDVRFASVGSEISNNFISIKGDNNVDYIKGDKYIVRRMGAIEHQTSFVDMDVYYCRKIRSSTPCSKWSKKTQSSYIYNYHLWNLLLKDDRGNKYNIVFSGK